MKMAHHDCLDHGIGLAEAGRLTEAIAFYRDGLEKYPGDWAILVNLANVLQTAGRFAESNDIYLKLLQSMKKPLAYRIASNYLAGLQYQLECSEEMIRMATLKLGAQFGFGEMLPARPISPFPLRIGFVGADLCHHPVGLFLLPLLQFLDRKRFIPILYSVGGRDDSVSMHLKAIAEWEDVAGLDYDDLLHRLRNDALDILVDLSGHTAGNRLPVFARRVSPLQVSWLGYFATTGIPAMDAVLMDSWHAPIGSDGQFIESVIRLPNCRFCYQPVSFSPEVSPLPCLSNGYITFGSFNNTAKYNATLFAVWAQILQRIPASRLVLKWRTFADESYRLQIWKVFENYGITRDRVELRCESSHAKVLMEYADIDVALDPFPFSGGMTSCEALWMGVPVVTWPGKRPVSRQTLCFIANLQQPEWMDGWVAEDANAYIVKALALAGDTARLKKIRALLRRAMNGSPLMDARKFARDFEEALLQQCALREEGASITEAKTILYRHAIN